KMVDEDGDAHMHDVFHIPIINVLWSIIGSHRFEYSQGRHSHQYIPLHFCQLPPLSESDEAMLYMKTRIKPGRRSPRDFIDLYLLEMDRNKGSPFFCKKQLIVMLFDFFLAGSETTSTTLLWMMLLMALHNDIQFKAPTEEDMKRLPFTMATIMEIQRFANIAPASLPHKVLKTLRVGKYTLPQGLPSLPTTTDSTTIPRSSVPHGIQPLSLLQGTPPRVICALWLRETGLHGNSLAKKQLFYFFVMILQRYVLRPDPKQYTMGITSVPDPSTLISRKEARSKLIFLLS
ncbi:Cytochrome P450 18A1, partial [Caligus rogercresseyi]